MEVSPITAPRRLRISAYAALSQAVTAVNIALEDRCTSRRLPKKNIWRLFPSLPALSGLMGAGFIVGRRYKRLCDQADKDGTERTMEQLSNPRWEAFAQLIAAGRSATAAYAQAYGRNRDTASRVNGRRLLTNANIQERIDEIRREVAANSAAPLQAVIEELGRSAVEKIQHGSFKQACETAGRFADLVINLANAVDGKKPANE